MINIYVHVRVCVYVCLLSIADICNGPICLTFIGKPHVAKWLTFCRLHNRQPQQQQSQQQQATGNIDINIINSNSNSKQAGKSNSVHQLIALVAFDWQMQISLATSATCHMQHVPNWLTAFWLFISFGLCSICHILCVCVYGQCIWP